MDRDKTSDSRYGYAAVQLAAASIVCPSRIHPLVPRRLWPRRSRWPVVTGVDVGAQRGIGVGNLAEVTRTIAELRERRILLRALREGVDTGTPTGRAVTAIMATLAELELELGRERRAASRESRRIRQLPATKPTKLTADRQEQLRRLAATGEPVRELAAHSE